MNTIIGAIVGSTLGSLAYYATTTNTAKRLTCRLLGHKWHKIGHIEHHCETHGLERVNLNICTRCGKKDAQPTDTPLRETPEE